jgi:hypothetical protein
MSRRKKESVSEYVFRELNKLDISVGFESGRDEAIEVLQHLAELYQENPRQDIIELILGFMEVFELQSNHINVPEALGEGASVGFLNLLEIPIRVMEAEEEELLTMIEEYSRQLWITSDSGEKKLISSYLESMFNKAIDDLKINSDLVEAAQKSGIAAAKRQGKK